MKVILRSEWVLNKRLIVILISVIKLRLNQETDKTFLKKLFLDLERNVISPRSEKFCLQVY